MMTSYELQSKFLSMVRSGPGYLARISESEGFQQEWVRSNDCIPDLADQYWAKYNLYVSLATFPDQRASRISDHATALFSFWADIDRHENSKYATDTEIDAAIDDFLLKTALPQPNLKHYTGYGLHIYWTLEEGLKLSDWQPMADQLQALLQTLQVGADPITADAARILRLPGTQNFRDPLDPVETRLVVLSEEHTDIETFGNALSAAAQKYSPPRAVATNQHPRKADLPPTTENVELVKRMLAVIDPDPAGTGGGNRTHWMKIVWGVASTGWAETAYQLARDWSESGDLFDERDFNRVWESYDPLWGANGKRGAGFGTLVHYARQAGYTGALPNAVPQPKKRTQSAGRLITKTANQYEPMPVDWLVDESIPLGAMVVIAGEPGLGKSQIAIRLAAAVTTGNGLPNDQSYTDLGSVIILANEDDAERTIRPRLEAAGADLDKVHIVEGVAREGEEADLFQLDQDITELRIKTAELGDVRMIVIDPPGAYLGSQVDSYKDTDVRRVLAPLAKLAQETGALVLLVVHLNKRTDGSPQQRITGSTAWTAAPRAAYLALTHQATKKRYLVPVKNNLGNDKMGFEYQILEKLLHYEATTIKTSYIDWVGISALTAAELLSPPRSSKPSVVDDAKSFLEDELAKGPKSVNELRVSAKAAGLSWAAIQRAKKELVINSTKLADQWQWTLVFGGRNA
jgi:putative DNA primase/helicase